MSIEFRELPIEELQPAPYNPRRPLNSTAYRKLKTSIAEFGLVEPLIWNESTGHVVGGHARLAILRELGYTQVSVSVVRLTAEREKALNIVLNNQEAQGRYDPAKLLGLLEELQELPEMKFTGFDASDMRSLKLDPVESLSPLEEPQRIEITLVVDPETYEAFAVQLDELVKEFDLVSHIRKIA